MKLPDNLLQTRALSATALRLPASPGKAAISFDAEPGKFVVAADLQAASDATSTSKPVHGC
jgi:hypothetical protein